MTPLDLSAPDPAGLVADAMAGEVGRLGRVLGLPEDRLALALIAEGGAMIARVEGRAALAARLRELADLVELSGAEPAGTA